MNAPFLRPDLDRLDAVHPVENGSLFTVPGVSGGAVATGVKPSGELDLALVVGDAPMVAAGMFTTCAVAAPPVHLCRDLLAHDPHARGVVVNSGNANALTGPDGATHARQMADAAAAAIGGPALVLSTGVIGVPLPIDKILTGIPLAASAVRPDGGRAADAILTTDTCAKTAAAVVDGAQKRVTVGGMAKGSGMIHPRMATTLAVMATDAALEPEVARQVLEVAVDRSFHEISVDGETSTNDAALLLCRRPDPGAGGPDDETLERIATGVSWVSRELARKVVEDGEGMTRLLTLHVTGAATEDEARAVATSVVRSALVKTALAGGDPNFGRILSAAGNAGVPVDPAKLSLTLAGHRLYGEGGPLPVDRDALGRAFAASEVTAILDLGRGDCHTRMLTTDLTHRYVEINAEYTT